MTTIHDTRHGHTLLERCHECRQDVIIEQDPRSGIINRHQTFVHAIVFITTGILNRHAVSGIMHKTGIARLCRGGQLTKGLHDIGRRRGRVLSIVVHEDGNVSVVKAVALFQIFQHVVYIILASAQGTGIVSHLVDTNQDGTSGASTGKPRRDHTQGIIQIGASRRGKLWHLGILFGLSLCPHLHQGFLKTQILAGIAVIGVRETLSRLDVNAPPARPAASGN